MEAKMWATRCILIVAALGSVVSADPIDDEEGKPSLRVLSKATVLNVGAQRALFCKGVNLPVGPEDINWYLPSGELVTVRDINDTGARRFVERKNDRDGSPLTALIFQQLKISDNGRYVCKAGDFNATFDVLVGIKVTIPKRTEVKEYNEKSDITLSCKASGHPLPVVQWYKDAQPIEATGSKKYDIKKKGDLYTLDIHNLEFSDAGEYVCKVTQKMLSHYTDKTITLLVKHAPILQMEREVEAYGIYGEITNLTCSAQANPPPTYRWFRVTGSSYDAEVSENDVVTAEDGSESVFSLKLRSEEDFGQYKCKIKNIMGNNTIEFHVSPGSKPPPPDFLTLVCSNSSSLTFNVTCSACNFTTEDDKMFVNPEHVKGFQFQLAPVVSGYPPEWDVAEKWLLDYTEDEIYTVNGLPNTTEFRVRVRSLNAAGYSEWFEVGEFYATTSRAFRLVTEVIMLMGAILAMMI